MGFTLAGPYVSELKQKIHQVSTLGKIS